MTTTVMTLPLSAPIPNPERKKRVLLIDTSPHRRELRSEIMRKLGIEVDSAADISEARSWWRADLYDLVLINVDNKQGNRDRFCEAIRSATPAQRFAFLVGKPEYLADSPGVDHGSSVQHYDEAGSAADVRAAALSADVGDLPQRWGILEASRRISAVRAACNARTQAMRNRPAPPRDPETRHTKFAGVPSRTLDELLREELR